MCQQLVMAQLSAALELMVPSVEHVRVRGKAAVVAMTSGTRAHIHEGL